jgi:hypothetical protein
MRNAVISLLVALCGCAVARAQNPLDDVYNWREPKVTDDPSAAKKWPPYYKPTPMLPEHQVKYANGWCAVRSTLNFRATPTYTIEPDEIIDPNKLPETKFTGKVVATRPGQLLVRNEAKELFEVTIHPDPQLSHVTLLGAAKPEVLKSGMFVRFSGKVDQHGEAREVEELELLPQCTEAPTSTVRVDERQVFVARFANRKGDQLSLRIKSDSIPRLAVKLPDAERIGLRASDYLLASEGDEVILKGRLYHPDTDKPAGDEIFATDVKIKLAKPVANVIKGRRKT